MDIVVSGASGLIGSALVDALRARGHRPIRMIRRPEGSPPLRYEDVLAWNPPGGTIDAHGLEGVDAVVHLAGAGIGDRRWTAERKREIAESRTVPTAMLAEALAHRDKPPSVMVSASAVGWYGNRGDELLTEASLAPRDPDFLSDVCVRWEAATTPAEQAGIRVVHIRTGIVLAPTGGVLARMTTPFRLGLGGRTGRGTQYTSWISLPDEVRAILHCIIHDEVRDAVNATGPEPVTNAEFARTLGRTLHRPAVLPTPLFALKAVYGSELVRSLLLAGQRVTPRRLVETGFVFRHPTLAQALGDALRRDEATSG